MDKVAFAYWGNRIAPVFDIARQIRIVEVESGRIVGESQEIFPGSLPSHKAVCLAELGVSTLVCGAVSRPVLDIVEAYGIRVIPFISGDVSEVINAWLKGRINDNVFSMPGCGVRKRLRQRGIGCAQQKGNGFRDTLYLTGQGRKGGRGRGRRG